MTKTITLEEASARFADVLRAVESGEEYHLTRDGREVARIVPASPAGERKLTAEQEAAWRSTLDIASKGYRSSSERTLTPEQAAAWRRTLARMTQGWTSDGAPFDRAALHER